jgi:hypothetical protein
MSGQQLQDVNDGKIDFHGGKWHGESKAVA